MFFICNDPYDPLFQKTIETLNSIFLKIETKQHQDGTFEIDSIPSNISEATHLWISGKEYPTLTFLWILMFLETLSEKNIKAPQTLVMPYFPFSRNNNSASNLFRLLKKAGIETLITLDYHTPKTSKNTPLEIVNLSPTPLLNQHINDNFAEHLTEKKLLLIAPDQGSKHRGETLSKQTEIPFITLNKIRDPKTGSPNLSITNAQKTCLEGKIAIIIDDIIDSGDTLNKTIDLLKDAGIKECHAFLTHGVFSKPYNRPPFLKTLYLGNSLDKDIKKEAFIQPLDFSNIFIDYFKSTYLLKSS